MSKLQSSVARKKEESVDVAKEWKFETVFVSGLKIESPLVIAPGASPWNLSSLRDYEAMINEPWNEPLTDNTYLRITELLMLLRNVRELLDFNMYSALSRQDKAYTSQDKYETVSADLSSSRTRKDALDTCILRVQELLTHRLGRGYTPRIVRLCEHYRMSETECRLFHLMVVVQGSTSPTVLNSLLECDENRRVQGFQRICRMSEVDVDAFCDAERQHIKEGIVMVEEEQGTHYNLRSPRTAVHLLYGARVRSDDLLKVAQTALEDILEDERKEMGDAAAAAPDDLSMAWDGYKYAPISEAAPCTTATALKGDSSSSRKRSLPMDGAADSTAEDNDDAHAIGAGPIKLVRTMSTGSAASTPGFMATQLDDVPFTEGASGGLAATPTSNGGSAMGSPRALGLITDEGGAAAEGLELGFDTANGARSIVQHFQQAARREYLEYTKGGATPRSPRLGPINDRETGDVTSFLPYPPDNQLEYLEDFFQIVALMIRGNSARMKDDMKKEGTRVHHYGDGEVKQGHRELAAKLRLMERKLERRVTETRAAGVPLPRLEVISERLKLDAFEKRMVVLLIGKTVSPVVKALIDTLGENHRIVDDSTTVGQALAILCQDFRTQVANRRYFYRSGRLTTNGIISLNRARWNQGTGDLTDQRITLDRRLLDWVVGLDSEINELVEGSDLYEPKVDLSRVVLPDGVKDMLVSQCVSYETFRSYRRKSGLEDVITYGNALVIMLCGKSGTGKTMTVNALANRLQKRVLLVDLGNLMGKSTSSNDMDADLRGLFREAAMNNALLFFDECENIFRSRDHGGDRMLNSLLTEIERHEGIVFLATNRPYEMDEAMHRRITAVVDYKPPDSRMRRAIWEGILCGPPSSDDASAASGRDEDADMKTTATTSANNVTDNEKGSAEAIQKKGLALDADVDLAAIAVKYELTGGFIKNAVMSALLIAIHRDGDRPVLRQSDLMQGCKLQMRSSMTSRQSEVEKEFVPSAQLNDLLLSPEQVKAANTIVRFERARERVYGSWSSAWGSSNTGAASAATTLTQRAAICALAGPSGSGKRTLCRALGCELGRAVKEMHVAELLDHERDALKVLKAAVNDARLDDSVLMIDGFEHILDSSAEGQGDGSTKLSLLLGRILGALQSFPGAVFLVCHMDSPQNITLQRDFASKLFCFIRMGSPSADIRTKLWQHLLPPLAPKCHDLKYSELGRRYDLNPGGIRNAVARAAAEAASRGEGATRQLASDATGQEVADAERHFGICQKDLMRAGEAEVLKSRVGNYDLVSKLFL